MIAGVASCHTDNEGFHRTVFSLSLVDFIREVNRTINVDRRREPAYTEHLDVSICRQKKYIPKGAMGYDLLLKSVIMGGTPDINFLAVVNQEDEGRVLKGIEKVLAASCYVRKSGSVCTASKSCSDMDVDDSDDDSSGESSEGDEENEVEGREGDIRNEKLKSLLEGGITNLCEKLSPPFLIIVSCPFTPGIVLFQRMSAYNVTSHKTLAPGCYPIRDFSVLKPLDATVNGLAMAVQSDKWVYEDYGDDDMTLVNEGRKEAEKRGISYAKYCKQEQISPSYKSPIYRPTGGSLITVTDYVVAAPNGQRGPVLGMELSEDEFYGQYLWGVVPQAARVVTPERNFFSLRQYLYNRLNPTYSFSQDVNINVLSLIKVGRIRTLEAIFADKTTFSAKRESYFRRFEMKRKRKHPCAHYLTSDESEESGAGIDGESKKAKAANVLPKPKGYLAAFNIFVQHNRKEVENEPAVKNANYNNNQVNKLLGRRWQGLSLQQREKYQKLSQNDKARYLSEVAEYNKHMTGTDIIIPRLKEGLSHRKDHKVVSVSRVTSAYGHFTHQERQWLFHLLPRGLMENSQKYLNARWHNMDEEEKEMYTTFQTVVHAAQDLRRKQDFIEASKQAESEARAAIDLQDEAQTVTADVLSSLARSMSDEESRKGKEENSERSASVTLIAGKHIE